MEQAREIAKQQSFGRDDGAYHPPYRVLKVPVVAASALYLLGHETLLGTGQGSSRAFRGSGVVTVSQHVRKYFCILITDKLCWCVLAEKQSWEQTIIGS